MRDFIQRLKAFYNRRRRFVLPPLTLAGLIAAYNIYAAVGIRLEERGRLSDPQVCARLAAVQRTGTDGGPAILLLHGFGGSPYDLRPLIDALPENFTVFAPQLPGHSGRSARELHNVDYEHWRKAVQAHTAAMCESHDRLILCGFSLGGLLALDAATVFDVEAVVVINPYTRVAYRPWYILPTSSWAAIGQYFLPYVRKLSCGRINDPGGLNIYDTAYLFLSQKSYLTLEAYSSFIRPLLVASPPACPVFMHISKKDIVSDPHLMRSLAEQMELPEENVSIWERSNHVLLFDYDAVPAIGRILEQIGFTSVLPYGD